jgi:hypothetical protein
MTTLEITLIILIWTTLSMVLAIKWIKADTDSFGLAVFACIVFMPIVLMASIIRQFFIRPWD